MASPIPASDLQDIHLPDPISWWPPAPGWWWMLGLLGGVTALGWLLRRRARRHRLRNAALLELDRLVTAHAVHRDDHRLAGELSILLRRVTLATRHRPAHPAEAAPAATGLTGTAWLQFLDQSLPDHPFSQGVGQHLITLPFQPPTSPPPAGEMAELVELCRTWLRIHAVSASH
ncbi:MAG: DUF4381 domain-containing protein [Magnetococcus sp. DMHC-8]